MSIQYLPLNTSNNTFWIGVINSSDNGINGSEVILNNTDWQLASVNFSSVGSEIREIRLYINFTSLKTNTLYVDNLQANNSLIRTGMVLKVWTNNSPNLAINISATYTDITEINATKSQPLWIWIDYFSPQFGQSISIDYRGGS